MKLIPRFTPAQAGARLKDIQRRLARGDSGQDLVRIDMGEASLNPTGGEAPTSSDLDQWRKSVMARMTGVLPGSKVANDRHSVVLGQALAECVAPSPSDAAHDGVWSYLSLWMFPDLVLQRWGASPSEGPNMDRWVGTQLGRDRNYLKLSWRRWQILGDILNEGTTPLGEDEFGALLERTAMARNVPLVRSAARQILAYSGEGSRMDFTRVFMKELTYLSGPLQLDTLDDQDLQRLTQEVADEVSERRPRRAVN